MLTFLMNEAELRTHLIKKLKYCQKETVFFLILKELPSGAY